MKKVNNTMNKNMQVTQLTPTQPGPFTYFQMAASTGVGVSGEIYLNGKKVHQFAEEGSQISNNEAQNLVKDGENSIRLNVNSVGDVTDRAAFSDSVIDIAIHALNTRDFPSNENRIIHITWNPVPDTGRDISYTFTVKRSN